MKILIYIIIIFISLLQQIDKLTYQKIAGEYQLISDLYNGIDYSKNCIPNENNVYFSISKLQQGYHWFETPEYEIMKEISPYKVGDTAAWFSFFPGGITAKDNKIRDINQGLACHHYTQKIKFDFKNNRIGLCAFKKNKDQLKSKEDLKYYWFNVEFQADSILTLTSQIEGHQKKVVLKKIKK
jgi:hypothetical protein